MEEGHFGDGWMMIEVVERGRRRRMDVFLVLKCNEKRALSSLVFSSFFLYKNKTPSPKKNVNKKKHYKTFLYFTTKQPFVSSTPIHYNKPASAVFVYIHHPLNHTPPH